MKPPKSSQQPCLANKHRFAIKHKSSSEFVHKRAQGLGSIAQGGEEERGRKRKEDEEDDDEGPSKWTWQTDIHP